MIEYLLEGIVDNPPETTEEWNWASDSIRHWESVLRRDYGISKGTKLPNHPNIK